MRWHVCSGLGCHSENIDRTSGTMLPASLPLLLWIGFTSCSATTATLALMLPGSRLCSFWKSFLKIMWSKMWRAVGEQRIWRTTTCSIGRICFKQSEENIVYQHIVDCSRHLPDSPPPLRWSQSPVHPQLPLIPLRKEHLSETKKASFSLRVSQSTRRSQRWEYDPKQFGVLEGQ